MNLTQGEQIEYLEQVIEDLKNEILALKLELSSEGLKDDIWDQGYQSGYEAGYEAGRSWI